MLSRVIKYISAFFVLIWMVIIFSEFWRYNPDYGKSIELFQYYDLLILFIGIGGFINWYLKRPGKKATNYLNGLSIFSGLLFLDIIAVNRFCSKVSSVDFSITGLFAHLGHIIGVAICLFLVYLVVSVLGVLFTTIFPLKINKQDLPIIQVALGIMLLTFLLFLLGVVGLLNGFVIIPICFLVFAFYWRQTYQIVRKTSFASIKIPKELNTLGVFSFLFLAVFLVLNFVQILRPFPIGSDSLRLYVNLPSLISEYGSLVDGNQPYNWSLFMSLGLTVFGRIDVVLGLSFVGGLFSLMALYRLSRKWLDINYSALVLLLFYSLPMISFLSYMDMKIDMGLMFITLSILLLYYNWVVPLLKENETTVPQGLGVLRAKLFFSSRIPDLLKHNSLLVLIGLLAGFAFGTKMTVLFFVLALYCTIWFIKGGKLAFFASFFLCFGVIFFLQLDAQASLRQFHQNVNILQWILLFIGMGLLVYLYINQRGKLLELMTYSLVIGSFFVLPVLPWLAKNYSETKEISVTSLLNGKKAAPIFNVEWTPNTADKKEIIIPGVYQMPDVPETSGRESKGFEVSAVSEDLHRFMGYEVLPARYLSLPYDVFINSNMSKFFTDVGFVLLLLFPILFLFPSVKNEGIESIFARVIFIGLSTLLLLFAIPSALLNQNNLSKSVDGLSILQSTKSTDFLGRLSDWINRVLLETYAPINDWLLEVFVSKDSVTYPLLIVLFLFILVLIFIRIERHSKVLQSFSIFLVIYFFLWWILGSGASWYGILVFVLPFIFFLKSIFFKQGEDTSISKRSLSKSIKKYTFLTVSMIWVLLAFVQRASNYTPIDKERAQRIYYPPILDYQMGNLKEDKLMDYHFPNVRQFVKDINRDKKSLVYMVGSPFNYFIHKNDSRVLSDTYLNFFDKLIYQFKTKDQIIRAFKAEGFKYIIFDLNMFTYDETPRKTLTRKFIQFMNTLYGNPGVELVATDRRIKLYDSGEEVYAVFQDKGTIVQSGSVAIFKIK